MPMGYNACFAQVATENLLTKVVGKELVSKYKTALTEMENSGELECYHNGEWLDFDVLIDDETPFLKKFDEAVNELATKFKEITGIEIVLSYHNKEEVGDKYDEVEGWYWEAYFSSLFQDTPAFKRLKKKYGEESLDRAFYVCFG